MPTNTKLITIVLATGNPHKVDELRAIFAASGAGANQNPVGNDGASAQQSSSPTPTHVAPAALAHESSRESPPPKHGRPVVTDRVLIRVVGLKDLPNHERFVEPEEIGTTFAANARIKAISYATQIALDPTIPRSLDPIFILADDSGIEIDALALADGTPRPGVISSHYCTDGRETGMTRVQRDEANNARVLRELEGLPPEKRAARFVCCMCLVGLRGSGRESRVAGFGSQVDEAASVPPSALGPQSSALPLPLHETRGEFEGRIGTPPRVPVGEHGFGYDPLFLVAAAPIEFAKTGAELASEEKNRLSHRGMAARRMVEWITNARLA